MSRTFTFAGLLLSWLPLSGVLSAQASESSHVVLISVDGLAAYHLENRQLHLPNIRRLIETGVWAEGAKSVFPSVTHPAHSTIITGVSPRRHGVIGNRLRDRRTQQTFHITNKPRSQSIRVETIFDAAHKKGLKTAAFFWPETREDPSLDFNVTEVFKPDGMADIGATRPELLQELRRASVPIDLYFRWYGDEHLRGAGDVVLTQAAEAVIARHRPQLLAIHLLASDVLQHNYGPEHYLAKTALTVADYCVGRLMKAVDAAGIEARTTFILTSDHGFATARYDLDLGPLFDRAGLAGRVVLHPQGWNLFVELKEPFDSPQEQALLEEVFAAALEVEGVDKVVGPGELAELGYPSYQEDFHVAGQYLIQGDIDTHFAEVAGASRPSRQPKKVDYHGHGASPEHRVMDASLVASGRGMKQGIRIGRIRLHDIAPTVAYLLGLELKGVEGRVLTEALKKEE